MESNLRRLQEDLLVDHALSLNQVARVYGLGVADLATPDFLLTHARLSKTCRSIVEETFSFVVLEDGCASLAGFRLRHLAGVAAMRHGLLASIADWVSDAAGVHGTKQPDAVWTVANGVCAIEYDSGSYTVKTLKAKLEAFHMVFSHQIWGCPSIARSMVLKRLANEIGCSERFEVMVAPWC
jgi:hypothetical protein